jgi:hypothetical protein
MAKALYLLHYNQPTLSGGKPVQGTTWYVSHKPGDGGYDWGYTKDVSEAIPLSVWWFHRFQKTHGSRAQKTETPA